MKAENKNKALGFLWSFLDPLLLAITYIILVHYIFGRGGPQFPVLLFAALLSWRWFASSVRRSVTSITSKVGLIQSTRFPLAILPLSGIVIGFFDWLFGFAILVPMLFIWNATFSVHVLWLPVLLFVQFIGMVGVCLIGAVWGTYLSDLGNIIQFLIRVAFYLTPIIWVAEERLPEGLMNLYMTLNPFAGLMESYRNVLVYGLPPSEYIIVFTVLACILFVVGLWYFSRDEYRLVKAI